MPERGVIAALGGIALCFVLTGCATWQAPLHVDYSSLRERAVTATTKNVHLRATVLSARDSRELFGVDINEADVQPVWIEVENNTEQTLWLLRSGADPNYFSPLEVAWSFHVAFSGETNAELDDYFNAMGFENPIAPGTTRSGIIFVHPARMRMLLNVDLLGQGKLFPFTLFPLVPDGAAEERGIDFVMRHTSPDEKDYQDPTAFRAALEQMPCCSVGEDAAQGGAPINVVLVGEFADIAAAVVRRGFRQDERNLDHAQRLFGRPPDIVVRKTRQGAPANWIRAWVAPLRYRGQLVFLVQAGRPVRGRFASADREDMKLHPDVDEVRNYLIQDLLYSGGLGKLAFAKVGGERSTNYHTDGLRVVMFFVTRPRAMSDVEILEWEPYLKSQEAALSNGSKDVQK